MQKVYSANQIAHVLGVPYSTIRTCMEKGELPYFELPGSKQKRVLEDDFLKFKESLDLPIGLSKAIIVEIGQTIILEENGLLTTYRVIDVTKNKLTVSRSSEVLPYTQSRIGGMV